MQRFRPPMTTARLTELAQTRHDDPDIVELLWYVARLRRYVRRFDQLLSSITIGPGGGSDLVARCGKEEIEEEPFIHDWRAEKDFLIDRKKPR